MGTGNELWDLFLYILPGILVALGALYVMKHQAKQEQQRRYFELRRLQSKEALSTRLEAYERLTLFLGRNSLKKLVLRTEVTQDEVSLYAQSLIQTIDREFDHNLSQQIYLSVACWDLILMAKNKTILNIRAAAQSGSDDVNAFRQALVATDNNQEDEMMQALQYLKAEVAQLW